MIEYGAIRHFSLLNIMLLVRAVTAFFVMGDDS